MSVLEHVDTVTELDTMLRAAARAGSADAVEEIARTFSDLTMSVPPRARIATTADRRARGIIGRGIAHVRDAGGEWDWFAGLPGEEQQRLRDRWSSDRGSTPDQLALAAGLDVDPAMRVWVDLTADVDALDRLAAGRGTPDDYRRGESWMIRHAAIDHLEAASRTLVRPLAGRAGNGARQTMQARAEQYAASRAGAGDVDPVAAGGEWPGPVVDYVARLVHLPKRDYAAALAAAYLDGAPMPDDPGAEWAGKVRAKLARLLAGVDVQVPA